MKNSKYNLALGIIFFGLNSFPLLSFAINDNCTEFTDTLHCVDALGNSMSSGKYLKVEVGSIKMMHCMPSGFNVLVDNKEKLGVAHLGQNNLKISICTDQSGQKCDLITNDVFVVSGLPGNYASSPASYSFDPQKFFTNDKYENCTPFLKSFVIKN